MLIFNVCCFWYFKISNQVIGLIVEKVCDKVRKVYSVNIVLFFFR